MACLPAAYKQPNSPGADVEPHQISNGIWNFNILKCLEGALALVICRNSASHNDMTPQVAHAS